VAEAFEHRPAAGGVDNDRGVGRGFECIDISSRELAGRVTLAFVRVEGATAALVSSGSDTPAVSSEDACRRAIDVREHRAHDAAGKESDLALGWGRGSPGLAMSDERLLAKRRQERFGSGEAEEAQ
jgi:hypothetical protein